MEQLIVFAAVAIFCIGYSFVLHSKIERIESEFEVLEANFRNQIEWLTQKYLQLESSKTEVQRKPRAGAINSLKKIVKPTKKVKE